MTRSEHLQWCKERALEYVEQGQLADAITSFASDYGKHEECGEINPHLMSAGIMSAMNNDSAGVRRFIEGFN